jgi:hypothetical protein
LPIAWSDGVRMIARRGAIKKRIAYYGKRYRWCKGKMGREKSSKNSKFKIRKLRDRELFFQVKEASEEAAAVVSQSSPG